MKHFQLFCNFLQNVGIYRTDTLVVQSQSPKPNCTNMGYHCSFLLTSCATHLYVFKLHCNWRGLGWWSQGLGIRVFGCQDLGGLSWSFNGCMNLCTSEICMSFWEGLLTPPHHQKAASKILTSSFSALNRVLEPSVLMELKLSDGKMHTFEVSVLSLNERCFSLH